MSVSKVTALNFKKFCSQDGIVLLDIYASWCPPCRGFEPVYKAASEKNSDCAFGRLNIDENKNIGEKLGIESIPTLLIFRDGILIYKEAGSPAEEILSDLIQQVKKLDMDEVRVKSKSIT